MHSAAGWTLRYWGQTELTNGIDEEVRKPERQERRWFVNSQGRVERPMGILRWDLTVPEGRHGSKAHDVQYSCTAEFDRSKVLSAKNMLEEMQVEFEGMMLPSAGSGFGGGFGSESP